MSLREHFRKGSSHWNQFIETYDERLINFELGVFKKDHLDLTGYRFPVPTIFYGCKFNGTVRIQNTTFESWVNFSEATFEKAVTIQNCIFEGQPEFESARFEKTFSVNRCEFKFGAKFEDMDVHERLYISDSDFEEAVSFQSLGAYGGLVLSRNTFRKDVEFSGEFDREAIFIGNRFQGFVDFGDAYFNAPLVLKNNVFAHRPAIDKIQLNYVPIMPEDRLSGGLVSIMRYYDFLHRLAKINKAFASCVAETLAVAKTDESYASLRHFRLIAQEYDDRRLALDIHALEQKSRRIWFDPPLSASFILGLIFQIFSDFGRSILRPLVALICLFLTCCGLLLLGTAAGTCSMINKLQSILLLSTNNTLPFLSWQKQALITKSEMCLFGSLGPTVGYGAMSIVQSALSLLLLFLIGLAIRNKLKMQS
jgi:hypothetical protein